MAADYSQGIAPYLAQFPRPATEAESLGAAVAALGQGLCIVDLGAGLGASSLALAAAGHQLIAVEPDAEMAAVLGARLAAAPELQPRLALLPASQGLSAGCADLLLCQSVLHLLLDEAEQIALLREAARLLRPGAQLWLELPLPSPQRQALPWALMGERQLGDTHLQHHREMHAGPGGDWVTDWRFELWQGERLLNRLERRYRWRPPTPETLARLAGAAGLQLLAIGADWGHAQVFDAARSSYGYPRLRT